MTNETEMVVNIKNEIEYFIKLYKENEMLFDDISKGKINEILSVLLESHLNTMFFINGRKIIKEWVARWPMKNVLQRKY